MDRKALERELGGRYGNQLDMAGFFQMLKEPSASYKFYWLEALVKLVTEGREQATFSEIADEMVASAWYSVVECRIHLSGYVKGEVRDALERIVGRLREVSGLSSRASSPAIKQALLEHAGAVRDDKIQLTTMVPYRALAGFLGKGGTVPWGAPRRFAAFTRQHSREQGPLPYLFGEGSSLEREVLFHPDWAEMIRDNAAAILGWIQFEKLRWLQGINIDVPNLVLKLAPPDEGMRKLVRVRKLWDGILARCQVQDVFKGGPVSREAYEVDHFVPWSFVMHDEIWNLMPMDASLNSAKSNKLPAWEPFFRRFAANQHLLYSQIHANQALGELFSHCKKDNLHAIWAIEDLYRSGNSREAFHGILENHLKPVYEAARRQGYEEWSLLAQET